jgi:hypothetical protein
MNSKRLSVKFISRVNQSAIQMEKAQNSQLWLLSRFEKVKQGGCPTVALPFTIEGILRQKKNYENKNISPC